MPERELSHEPMPLDRPIYEPAALNDLRIGSNVIRDAFLKTTLRFAGRNTVLVPSGASEPAILLIRSGFALCSCILSSGRRAILDLFIPGDVCGLFYLFTKYPADEITAVDRIGYHALPAGEFRALLSHSKAGVSSLAMMADARYRAERLAAIIGRLDARERICVLFIDLYERLDRRKLTNGLSFHCPLTQEQIADFLGLTLVHVNRTLRRLREDGWLIMDRQTVTIREPDRLRTLVSGLPCAPDLPTRIGPADALITEPATRKHA